MWPATEWMVVGPSKRWMQDVTGPEGGFAASLPQKRSRPTGMRPASWPYLRIRSKSAAVRSHSGPASPFAHGSSTGAGSRVVSSGVRPALAGTVVSTARDRSGRRPFRRL